MGPAPPIDCARCGRTIAKRRAHIVLRDPIEVLCLRCFDREYSELRGRERGFATRAAAANLLGLWP
jgi:hypothetical protein